MSAWVDSMDSMDSSTIQTIQTIHPLSCYIAGVDSMDSMDSSTIQTIQTLHPCHHMTCGHVTCGALNVSPRLHSRLPLVPDLTVNDLVVTSCLAFLFVYNIQFGDPQSLFLAA